MEPVAGEKLAKRLERGLIGVTEELRIAPGWGAEVRRSLAGNRNPGFFMIVFL